VKQSYRSDIPSDAREEVVKRHPNGAKARCDYFDGSDHVGWRQFEADGVCILEVPLLGGKQHGTMYTWFESGELMAAEPWVDGREHGIARQWDRADSLVGSYEMVRGTGIDLWWHERFEGPGHFLAEARYLLDGDRHGYEWWINEDQASVSEESHWHHGQAHGIHRQWRDGGRLCKGFPKFFVAGTEVQPSAYNACLANDPSLPPFRKADDDPTREFPEEVKRALRRP
jgi:antitoxin component YwqK of YwqJK toxin-antitoxin module